jgi:hypothetical protein
MEQTEGFSDAERLDLEDKPVSRLMILHTSSTTQ